MTRLSFGLVAATAWLPADALAEVCDKAVGDSWMPEHGPVWLFNPVGWPIWLVILLLWLVMSARGAKWFGYAGAAFLVAQVAVAVLMPEHDIYRAQLREGCRSLATDWADVGLITLFAITYGWLGFRQHRAEARRILAETDI